MKSIIYALVFMLFGNVALAETHVETSDVTDVNVVFSPDPEGAQALVSTAQALSEATETIDIAIYNMGSKETNPVVALFSTTEMQEKIQSGELKIRLLFEGFSSAEGNAKRMTELEELGIDVRHLGSFSSKKMHHKFAVVDGKSANPILVTGSGNWSLTSATKYDENTLFFRNTPGLAASFFSEFQFLWSKSESFGNDLYAEYEIVENFTPEEEGLEAYFNIDNFTINRRGSLSADRSVEGWTITRQIVKAIDQAEKSIQIATTRFKLRPIYDAVIRAAERGVDVKIIVTMDEYEFFNVRESAFLYPRKITKERNRIIADLEYSCDEEDSTQEFCAEGFDLRAYATVLATDYIVDYPVDTELVEQCNFEPFDQECSSGVNFAVFLDRNDYPGHENVSVRIKWFHMNPNANLTQQMHSKYMVIDSKTLLTGSFNWSNSAEYNHIENIVKVSGPAYHQVLRSYGYNFNTLWDLRRENYLFYVDALEQEVAANSETRTCKLDAMSLSFSRIDYLLDTGLRMGSTLGCSSEGSTGVE